jgi:hypothetical protein
MLVRKELFIDSDRFMNAFHKRQVPQWPSDGTAQFLLVELAKAFVDRGNKFRRVGGRYHPSAKASQPVLVA